MDKPEVWLRRLLYEIITPLLSHNESLYHVRLVSGTHIFGSVRPRIQLWVGLQDFLQQNTGRNSFIYCEVEQDLWYVV